ncbi:MAG: molybdopterin molybdotransferase MoeA [Oscillospiraceae bacterium]|jgi:molybdopterin molybdotransferase|nr:molybdopterin molybdotransferase MoeA [Oscillospiraceae bacterium]
MEGKKKRISLEGAREKLRQAATPVGLETLPFSGCLGRVAAETVRSDVSVPPFDRSPLDGYALRADDTAGASIENPVRLTVTEEIAAGSVPAVEVTPGTAAKILTGAPMPGGADCVVRFESTEFDARAVSLFAPLSAGENVVPAGDDIKPGEIIINAGEVVTAAHLGLLASADCLNIGVFRRPKIALINTGDEITEPGEPLPPGKIRNSARYVIGAMLAEAGAAVSDGYTVPDRAEPLAELISELLRGHDMVVTTGGVSVGDYDMVRRAVSLAGGNELFWKVAFRPGGTILASEIGGKTVLGLSGNPSSAALGMYLLGLPHVRLMAGRAAIYPIRTRALLLAPIHKDSPHGRVAMGSLEVDAGRVGFRPVPSEGHGAVSSMLGCNLIADIPPGTPPLPAGAEVDAYWVDNLC